MVRSKRALGQTFRSLNLDLGAHLISRDRRSNKLREVNIALLTGTLSSWCTHGQDFLKRVRKKFKFLCSNTRLLVIY
jgi:hypothetical protein